MPSAEELEAAESGSTTETRETRDPADHASAGKMRAARSWTVSGGRLVRRGSGRVGFLRDYAIVAMFIALFVTLAVSSNGFLTKANLLNVLDQASVTGLVACGGTLVIIAGAFDLSAGAIYAVSGIIAAMMSNEIGPVAGIVVGILSGLAFGIGNGGLVTVARITPFIATLASAIAIGGLATVLTGGFIVTAHDAEFKALGQASFLTVKYSIWIFITFALICGFILSRTTFGRCIYAAGANAEVARLSGVRVGVIRTATFAISGLSASLAGVVVASLLAQGDPGRGGFNLVVNAIAAIAVGGTSILGGEGAIWRTMMGALLLTLLTNGFNLLNVQEAYQQIVQGAIILAAIALDSAARRGRA